MYLVSLHLQAGRGLVENMIPPVEAELLSFSMTNLRGKKQPQKYFPKAETGLKRRRNQRLTPPLSHFTLTLMASDMPFSARPSPLPAETEDRVRHQNPDDPSGRHLTTKRLTVFPAVTEELLLSKL